MTSHRLTLAELRSNLSAVVQRLEREHGRVVITKHGRPAAVVLSVEDLESLEETLAVLSDEPLMREIRQGLAELADGSTVALSKADALALTSDRD